jgi:hypothetical protein
MSAHRIGPFPAEFWRGEQPDFAHQRSTSHTRAGANGVGRVLVGKSGRAFWAELEFHAITYARGLALIPQLMNLTGRPPVMIIHNYRPLWLAPYRHLFYVNNVRLIRTNAMPRIVGPGYNYLGGTAVTVAIELEPFPLF